MAALSAPAQAPKKPTSVVKAASPTFTIAKSMPLSKGANGISYSNKRRCLHEMNCKFLMKGPELCGFLHSDEEILFHHPNYCVPADKNTKKKPLTKDVVSCTRMPARVNPSSAIATKNDAVNAWKTESTISKPPVFDLHFQEILVESNSVGFVLGKNHKNLVRIMSETGTKIKIWEKNENGSVLFRVSGASSDSVDAAITYISKSKEPTNSGQKIHSLHSLKLSPTTVSTTASQTPYPSNENAVGAALTIKTNAGNGTKNTISASTQATTSNAIATEDSTSILSALTCDGDFLGSSSNNTAGATAFDNISCPIVSDVVTSILPSSTMLTSSQPVSLTPATAQSISSFSPEPAQQLLTPNPLVSVPDAAPASVSACDATLMAFLVARKDCFKVPPETFHSWLITQDIVTMQDLMEACEDDEFVSEEMRTGGLKAFKKRAFIKAVSANSG